MKKILAAWEYFKGLCRAAATGDSETFENYKANWKTTKQQIC